MTKDVKQKLTLDRPVTYQIKVPGHLDESWTEWDGRMTVAVESEDNRPPVRMVTGGPSPSLSSTIVINPAHSDQLASSSPGTLIW